MGRQKPQPTLKGGFYGCKWCHGSGCMACDAEREAANKRRMEPIFVADPNNPDDMRQMREIFGAEALAKAFGPGGRGMQEIEENAAFGSLIQLLRKSRSQDA